MTIPEFVSWIMAIIIGSVLSSIIVGIMTDKFVIRRVLANKDVQDLVALFREAKEYLHDLLENQKKKKEV